MKFKDHVRIICAITLKDIGEAIKSKIVQGVLIGVAFMMFSSQALSLLVMLKEEPTAYLWDQGKSAVIKEVVRSRKLNLRPIDNLFDLQEAVSQSAEPMIGIVIPIEFDELVATNENFQLKIYFPHWSDPESIAEVTAYFEENLAQMIGVMISFDGDNHKVYPTSDGLGYPMMIAFGVVLGVMTVGLILTPYLIVDEKETHTLDALLISPAQTVHLLIGKSLVGLCYSLIASSLIFILSWRWIVNWDIIILAIVFGGLSSVSIGLLVGTIFDSPVNVNMFVGLLIAVFLIPMYLWTSIAPKLSPYLQTILEKLPTIAMYKLTRQSFVEIPSSNVLLVNTIILLSWTFVILGLVAWRIRNLDR